MFEIEKFKIDSTIYNDYEMKSIILHLILKHCIIKESYESIQDHLSQIVMRIKKDKECFTQFTESFQYFTQA
jgi:hypothetical protein